MRHQGQEPSFVAAGLLPQKVIGGWAQSKRVRPLRWREWRVAQRLLDYYYYYYHCYYYYHYCYCYCDYTTTTTTIAYYNYYRHRHQRVTHVALVNEPAAKEQRIHSQQE